MLLKIEAGPALPFTINLVLPTGADVQRCLSHRPLSMEVASGLLCFQTVAQYLASRLDSRRVLVAIDCAELLFCTSDNAPLQLR